MRDNNNRSGVLFVLLKVLELLALIVIAVALVYLAIDVHAIVVDMRAPWDAPWINNIQLVD